jgi:CheY-like chemotaxis protein
MNILLVDDSENDRLIIRRVLMKNIANLSFFEVGNVEHALAYLRLVGNPVPEFILCDMSLGHQNGFTLIDSIRSFPELRRVPIAFMSGLLPDETRRIAFEKGACACIEKDEVMRNPAPLIQVIEERLRR